MVEMKDIYNFYKSTKNLNKKHIRINYVRGSETIANLERKFSLSSKKKKRRIDEICTQVIILEVSKQIEQSKLNLKKFRELMKRYGI
jgi:hypothetical protein